MANTLTAFLDSLPNIRMSSWLSFTTAAPAFDRRERQPVRLALMPVRLVRFAVDMVGCPGSTGAKVKCLGTSRVLVVVRHLPVVVL